ncbi:hypothetical protein ACEPPN_014262 [Leptodophora sp. 'Broadleaf-Isolate-01']
MCTDFKTTYRECGHEIREPSFCYAKRNVFTQIHLAAVARDEEKPRPEGYMSREDERFYYRYEDEDSICSVRPLADEPYFKEGECDYCMTEREAPPFEPHLPFRAKLPFETKMDEEKKAAKVPKADAKKMKLIEQRPQIMRAFR